MRQSGLRNTPGSFRRIALPRIVRPARSAPRPTRGRRVFGRAGLGASAHRWVNPGSRCADALPLTATSLRETTDALYETLTRRWRDTIGPRGGCGRDGCVDGCGSKRSAADYYGGQTRQAVVATSHRMGRSRPAGVVQQHRRKRHALRAARRICRQTPRGHHARRARESDRGAKRPQARGRARPWRAETGAGPIHWFEDYNSKNSRAWLVTNPQDGKVPPQTDEARQRAAAVASSAAAATDSTSARSTDRRTYRCTIAASRAASPVR